MTGAVTLCLMGEILNNFANALLALFDIGYCTATAEVRLERRCVAVVLLVI